jgi:hypothetical protein
MIDREIKRVLSPMGIFAVRVKRGSKKIWRFVTVPIEDEEFDTWWNIHLEAYSRWPNSIVVFVYLEPQAIIY